MFCNLEKEVDILENVCNVLTTGQVGDPADLLDSYKFKSVPMQRKAITPCMAVRVFVRDGFIDRYSGQRLFFPPVLRVISARLGQDHFPFHSNWRTDCTHPAFWDLGATVDHLVPVSRGGKQELENYRTSSMRLNAVKSNCLLEELGWKEQPRGNVEKWDGLLGWFLEYVKANSELLDTPMIGNWYSAVFSAARKDRDAARLLARHSGASVAQVIPV